MEGAQIILAERERQVTDEGWSPEHDDAHADGSLAVAAACYSAHAAKRPQYSDIVAYRQAPPPPEWPWGAEWWKPKNPVSDLKKAGALCAAEIDRHLRAMASDYADTVESSSS